jgi:two-component system heavy metal sensor histidine kinase CusS
MDDRLEDVAEFLAFAVGALLLASGGLAWIIARGGLAPVRKLARETDRIGERSLHLRLATERVPPDLIPLAKAVNALLKRLTAALDRERQFSADAAHELRTPVAVLKSGVQAALLTKRRVADDQKAFEELLDEVKRLEKLCESLLLIASPERDGKPEALLDPRDWIACVAETVEDFRTLALANESELSFHPPSAVSGSVALRTDEATARRITANLVENAIRHGGGGVRIDVTVSLDAEGASLVVEDNGVGIAPENEDRLFDRFFRADKARARATGGVGLGLAISRALAEAAGGSVRYERPPQRGSRFIWSVALARDAETAA